MMTDFVLCHCLRLLFACSILTSLLMHYVSRVTWDHGSSALLQVRSTFRPTPFLHSLCMPAALDVPWQALNMQKRSTVDAFVTEAGGELANNKEAGSGPSGPPLRKELDAFKEKMRGDRDLMVIRQLATSFQFRCANYVGVGKVPLTLEQLDIVTTFVCAGPASCNADKEARHDELLDFMTNTSRSDMFYDYADLFCGVSTLKEMWTGSTHPTHMLTAELLEVVPTKENIDEIIDRAWTPGKISDHVKEAALALVVGIVHLSSKMDKRYQKDLLAHI